MSVVTLSGSECETPGEQRRPSKHDTSRLSLQIGSHSMNEQSKPLSKPCLPTVIVPELQIFPGVEPVTSESSQWGGAFFCDLGRIYAVTILVSLHLPMTVRTPNIWH